MLKIRKVFVPLRGISLYISFLCSSNIRRGLFEFSSPYEELVYIWKKITKRNTFLQKSFRPLTRNQSIYLSIVNIVSEDLGVKFSSPYEELVYISTNNCSFYTKKNSIRFSSPYEELVYIFEGLEQLSKIQLELGFRPLTRNQSIY